MSRASEIRRQKVVVSASYVGSCGFEIGRETDSFNSCCLWIVQFKERVTLKTKA
jgi:hypothetical protein